MGFQTIINYSLKFFIYFQDLCVFLFNAMQLFFISDPMNLRQKNVRRWVWRYYPRNFLTDTSIVVVVVVVVVVVLLFVIRGLIFPSFLLVPQRSSAAFRVFFDDDGMFSNNLFLINKHYMAQISILFINFYFNIYVIHF